jgi:radical SAM superfamily enzyme YgiQ (UPF0313 family)
MIDICLIKTPVPELLDDRLDPPAGLLSLAAVLQRDGLTVEIIDLSGIPEYDWEFPAAFRYGFSTYTASYNRTLYIKDRIKHLYPEATTIAGGPHASALPEEVAREFDTVVVGEGESVISGIVHGCMDCIIYAKPIPIEKLPRIDYSLVDFSSYTRRFEGKPSFPIYTSRGCPYLCKFCSSLPGGRKVRRRAVNNVIEEIVDLKDVYGDVSFRMKDDLFASNSQWLQEFADIVPGIQYSCNVRADFNNGTPDLLAKSGCIVACMGIESGSDAILRAMGKGATRQQNLDAIAKLKRAGIKVLAWIIVGYPGETWETLEETVTLLEESRPELVTIYPLIPYPGTKAYEDVRIIDHDYSHYFYIHGNKKAGFVYETDDLPVTLIKEMWEYMQPYSRSSL